MTTETLATRPTVEEWLADLDELLRFHVESSRGCRHKDYLLDKRNQISRSAPNGEER